MSYKSYSIGTLENETQKMGISFVLAAVSQKKQAK
jgi:hypothetical protein